MDPAVTVRASKCALDTVAVTVVATHAGKEMVVRVSFAGVDLALECVVHLLVVFFAPFSTPNKEFLVTSTRLLVLSLIRKRRTVCTCRADCDPGQCASGLVCGDNNCYKFHKISSSTGFTKWSDCCERKRETFGF